MTAVKNKLEQPHGAAMHPIALYPCCQFTTFTFRVIALCCVHLLLNELRDAASCGSSGSLAAFIDALGIK